MSKGITIRTALTPWNFHRMTDEIKALKVERDELAKKVLQLECVLNTVGNQIEKIEAHRDHYKEALENITGPCLGSKRKTLGVGCDCDPCVARVALARSSIREDK